MKVLAYGATDQSASFENGGNQVSTPSQTGENTTLEVNTSMDHVSPAGGSEASQTPKPNGSVKTKPSGDVCSYVASCVMVCNYTSYRCVM